jgi:Tol biopolymer transport system component
MKALSLILKRIATAAVLFAATALPFKASAVDLVSGPDATFSPPVSAGGDSYNPLISADGRYVLFTSSANNLARRTNGAPYILTAPLKQNVFLHDRVQGTTTLISADASDTKSGEDDSTPTSISTNGQYVLFETASRLTAARDSTNRLNTSEVYLRDVLNKTTTLVSVRTNSQFYFGARQSVMTPDARYVAFESADPNFVSGDTNATWDVFVRDLASGQTQMASAGFSNRIASFAPEITPDGKFVAFVGNLVSVNPTQDVYVCDLGASNTFCVSSNSHAFIPGVPWCYGQRISDDGKYVAYQANLLIGGPNVPAFVFRHNIQTGTDDLVTSNSVPVPSALAFDMSPDGRFIAFIAKTNSSTGVFLWDGQTGTSTFVSADTNGLVPASMSCEAPRVDPTGRFVSFFGTANGFVTNAIGNFQQHIYRRDMQTGITELVDAGIDGNATNRLLSTDFSISADGRFFAFDSPDTDLVVPDGNNASDIFVRDLNAETTELASASDPSLATATGGRGVKRSRVRVSADGNYAVFVADGTDLVPNYTNHFPNIFARDLVNQSNFVVSVDLNGLPNANAASTEPSISGDGRYVAFTSSATNLVSHDTNFASDVFLRDLQTGTTVLVSTNGSGPGSGNLASSSPNISLDGRYITYYSSATNIVPTSVTLPNPNLFVYDRTLRTNYILATNGVLTSASSPDGRYIAFYGNVFGNANVYIWDLQLKQRIFTNIPPPGSFSFVAVWAITTNSQWLAYISSIGVPQTLTVIDRLTRSNITVSAGAFGARPNPRFSGDGRFLVYSTAASNSPPDFNKSRDVYVFDVLTRSNTLVSRSFFTGNAATGNSDSPDISADGRYITYQSDAPDIVPGDNNREKDIFLYDQQSGSTMLLSASLYGNGTADFESQAPRFTGDGQTVAFQSWASDLTANDFNQGSDLFLLKILNPIGSTNPPPVFTGQIIFSPGSGGSGPGQSSPQLTWAAAPGVGYQVQYKTNLTDDAWLPVNGSVVIQNGQGYINDLAPDPDHRFYRIVGF